MSNKKLKQKKVTTVTVEIIDGKYRFHYPYPATFFVDSTMTTRPGLTFVELTLHNLIKYLIVNTCISFYCKLLRMLRNTGFLTTTLGGVLTLKDFTLKFWKYRIKLTSTEKK